MNKPLNAEELKDADLDGVDGAGFLEPVITRIPKSDLVGYREEFGVERPKGLASIEGIEYGADKPTLK